jgi:hypothetical protein
VEGLAAYLRDRDTVIVCNAAQLAVDEHLVEDAATDPAESEMRSAPQSAPRPRIPAQRGIQQTPTTAIPERNESGGG